MKRAHPDVNMLAVATKTVMIKLPTLFRFWNLHTYTVCRVEGPGTWKGSKADPESDPTSVACCCRNAYKRDGMLGVASISGKTAANVLLSILGWVRKLLGEGFPRSMRMAASAR